MSAPKVYDVVVLGSGIAGSMLGAILARHGTRVLILDAGVHPKFAIGESTIPYTLVALRTVAERYDVPEIKTLATFTNCTRVIAPSHGVKKHFGFLIHHEGQSQDPAETNQFNTPGLLHEASHMFRQDTDAYLFHAALKYGCEQRQNAAVVDVEFDGAGADVTIANGERFRGRYVVDASGFRSPLAEKYGLRDTPCRFKHHSRSMWNHMVGVTPTDQLFAHQPRTALPPVPWYQGTVHHMFERGWFWVIGFDNHKASRSPLCSVGLTLDPRRYPRDESLSPGAEFEQYAQRFPDIARQYQGARPVRDWISTGRLQYSSRQVVGDRWCLLSHAAGFIDPLFSRGLSNTAEAVNALAWRLLDAVRDDDFSAERFEYIDRLQQSLFDFNDELVNAAFISFSDYQLWSAVFRIWAWGSNAGTFRLQEGLTEFMRDGRDSHLRDLEEAAHLGFYWPDHDGYRGLFDTMVRLCDEVEAGVTSSAEAADRLYVDLVAADFVPKHFGFSDRNRRFLNPTPVTLIKTIRWARQHADPRVRDLMFGVGKDALLHKLTGRRIF
ncbi:MAG TPA: tryptophan 7-halogenase [Pseudonocardia sp.]|uniref:NAD(P)/FAD-dependent oxidoreductase n=1 Tax=Pseudonocardia sp. TaxID=60912 RepID=UPI002F3F8A92